MRREFCGVMLKEVWTDHSPGFFEAERNWLQSSLGGRLRHYSLSDKTPDQIIRFIFITDWFRAVKVGSARAIILHRKKGEAIYVVRISDLSILRQMAIFRNKNSRRKKLGH